MFLYDIFLKWNASKISEPFNDLVLKRDDLTLARNKEVACYRLLDKDTQRINAYKHFLMCCERALKGIDEKPLLDFLVNDLMTDPGLSLNEVEACDKLTQLFCLHFQKQENILELAPMGKSFIGEPQAFAAFLRYLLHQGLSSETILSTHLLQDFFLYYCSTIGQINNPIEKLYRLLQAFPETLPLTNLAKTICCDEESLASYALDGSAQHPTGHLTQVEHSSRIILYTPNKDNLNTLYAVFGIDFLMAALCQWDKQQPNTIWVSSIAQLFNQPYTVATQLPNLLTRLYEQTLLQKTVAKILNDATLMELLKNRADCILYLIPFCPQLKEAIPIEGLSGFIDALRQQANQDKTVLIANLFGVYDGVKHNIEAGAFVLNALLDEVLCSAYALDDVRLIGKLRSCINIHDCITKKIRALEFDLDTIIQLNTQRSIQEMQYVDVKDVWRMAALSIKHLQLIAPSIKSTCPENEYILYNRLARAFLEQSECTFELNTFATALGVNPDFERDNVTIYERALIELLVAIDEHHFRTTCIEHLDTYSKHPWRTRLYNDMSLMHHAALAGNLGLIQWLEMEKIPFPDSYDSLASDAIKSEQWPIVTYFNTHKTLSPRAINSLLFFAITHDVLPFVPSLLSDKASDIEATLEQAVHLDKQESIRYIIGVIQKNSIKPPIPNLVTTVAPDAIHAKKVGIVKSLSMTAEFGAIESNEMANKQARTSYFQKSSSFEKSAHSMVTRAFSCGALSTLQQGFFKPADARQLPHSAQMMTTARNGVKS